MLYIENIVLYKIVCSTYGSKHFKLLSKWTFEPLQSMLQSTFYQNDFKLLSKWTFKTFTIYATINKIPVEFDQNKTFTIYVTINILSK
jgi:hypothetical protein